MTGRITSKGYMYYMILNLKDEGGRYKQKWIRTGLSTRLDGNRERAEGMLYERLKGNSAATFLLSQGHSLLEIMLQLGHKKQESSARYTHLQSSALVGIAKSFDSLTI